MTKHHAVTVTAILISLFALALAIGALSYGWWQQSHESDRIERVVHSNQQRADRRFCAMLDTLRGDPGNAPQSPYGKAINAAAHDLAVELGCPHA